MSATIEAGGDNRDKAVAQAAETLRRGELVVLPTDTVYGVAADAFSPTATAKVFTTKGRSRDYPLPVLVDGPTMLPGFVASVSQAAERLMAAYWPGALTLVLAAEEGLMWDLGDNQGTVAVRMPDDEVALATIGSLGPLAVTSANQSGQPAARNVVAAREALGEAIAVYVDDGPREGGRPSTIVDLTRTEPFLIRDGDLPPDEVMDVARGASTTGTAPDTDAPDASSGTDIDPDRPMLHAQDESTGDDGGGSGPTADGGGESDETDTEASS